MAKRGPPKKFTAEVKAEIIDGLALGMSLAEMLRIVGFSRAAYQAEMTADPEFCQGVKGAADNGKRKHLDRVNNAEERWQASAWFLERKYGAEYGQKVTVEGSVVVLRKKDVEAGNRAAQDYRRDRLAAAQPNSNGHDDNGQAPPPH